MHALQPLIDELKKPDYAALTDHEAAAILDAKRVVIKRPAQTWRVKQLAIEDGYYPVLFMTAQSADVPVAIRGLAISVLAWVDDSRIQTVDMLLPSVQTMLTSLVSAGLLSALQSEKLQALADVEISWAESVGINGPIGAGFVHNARLEFLSFVDNTSSSSAAFTASTNEGVDENA